MWVVRSVIRVWIVICWFYEWMWMNESIRDNERESSILLRIFLIRIRTHNGSDRSEEERRLCITRVLLPCILATNVMWWIVEKMFYSSYSPLFTVGRLLFLLVLAVYFSCCWDERRASRSNVECPPSELALSSNNFFVRLIELDPYVVHFLMVPTTILRWPRIIYFLDHWGKLSDCKKKVVCAIIGS